MLRVLTLNIWNLSGDWRARREAIVAFVNQQRDASAAVGPVIAGDFNAEPDSTAVRYLTGLTSLGGGSTYFQDAWRLAGDAGPGLTWSSANAHAALEHEPDRRIDYIFVRGPDPTGRGEPLDAHVCFDRPQNGVYASDHFGVSATIRVEV